MARARNDELAPALRRTAEALVPVLSAARSRSRKGAERVADS
jgi:hypothetical protein